MNIFGNTDGIPVILNREDTFEELNDKFPGLVKKKVLFTLKSKFNKKLLEIYMVHVDVELIRFGILVDGVDSHQVLNFNGQTSDFLEYELKELVKTA